MTQIWEPCPLCGEEPIYVENGGFCTECGQLHDVTDGRVLLHENLSGHIIRKGYGEPDDFREPTIRQQENNKGLTQKRKVGGKRHDKVGWRG